jgi:hypothetical protein
MRRNVTKKPLARAVVDWHGGELLVRRVAWLSAFVVEAIAL